MKLTATETGNYLVRLYEAIQRKAGTRIKNCDQPIQVAPGCISIGSSNNGEIKLYLAPAWQEYCQFAYNYRRPDAVLHLVGLTGETSISVQLGDIDEAYAAGGVVGEIPFKLSFDMKTDVDNFIAIIGEITEVNHQHETPAVLTIKVGDETFRTLLKK